MSAPDPEHLFTACAEALLPAGAPLVLAVSGGSDSMALLAAGARWDRTRVVVAHVHHADVPGLGSHQDGRNVAATQREQMPNASAMENVGDDRAAVFGHSRRELHDR